MSEETDTPICDNAEFISGGVRTGWVRAEAARDLERELMEQARLNGMGSEREASMLAQIDRLQKENATLRQAIDKLAAQLTSEAAQNDAAALP